MLVYQRVYTDTYRLYQDLCKQKESPQISDSHSFEAPGAILRSELSERHRAVSSGLPPGATAAAGRARDFAGASRHFGSRLSHFVHRT